MLNMIPYPSRKIHEWNDFFVLPNKLQADLGGFESWCLHAFQERTGLEVAEGTPWLKLERDASLEREAYALHVRPQMISVRAADEQGVIWALTTAALLCTESGICCCEITDAPRYHHRGLNLDCARHFFAAAEVKKIIEEISLVKMNVLHWHLTDDQGWRIESKRFPRLHETSGVYYTQEEIRQIVEYARVRGVEIIPEIDMPGHSSSFLAAYPQYSCFGQEVRLAASGGIFSVILCPGKDETFTVLTALLDEIVGLFPGPRFHIGGDEAPKAEWRKCPDCNRRMQELGLSEEELQGYFTQRICDHLKKHGKIPVCWNETLLASNYPKAVQIQYWTLQHRKVMEHFTETGGSWIYSDTLELYLDYPYAMSSMKKIYGTVPHLGKKDFSSDPGLLGMEACLWTEHISQPQKLEQMLFPRLHALAEIAWSGKRTYSEFCMRLTKFIRTKLHSGICYKEQSGWDPKGKVRHTEAFRFLAQLNSGMSPEVREQTVKSAAPSKEFAMSFMKKFFKPWDIFFFLKVLSKK